MCEIGMIILDRLTVLWYNEFDSVFVYFVGWVWGNAKKHNNPNLQR